MSSFHPKNQENHIESKIVVALERIAEAFRVLLWVESRENGLSPIQIQILVFLLFHDEAKSRISYLAQEFNMTKATVSESVKVLLRKELITQVDDPLDARSFTLVLTPAGRAMGRKAAAFAQTLEKPLRQLPDAQQAAMLDGLLHTIHDLHRAGIISVQRMCHTCAHYRKENGRHYCRLLQTWLEAHALRLDCPEHTAAE